MRAAAVEVGVPVNKSRWSNRAGVGAAVVVEVEVEMPVNATAAAAPVNKNKSSHPDHLNLSEIVCPAWAPIPSAPGSHAARMAKGRTSYAMNVLTPMSRTISIQKI